jgi:PAS domain S-box-containing protein
VVPLSDPPALPRGDAAPRLRELAVVFDLLSEVVVLLDRDARMLYASSSLRTVLDRIPAEAEGQVVFDFVHPDDRARAEQAFRGVLLAPGGTFTERFRVATEHGGYRWLDATVRALLDEPSIGAVLVVARDVTAHRDAEERLRGSEALLASILDSTADGIMAFRSVRDASGAIADFEWLAINQAAERMVARGANELLGRRLLEEMPGNRTEGLHDKYVRVVETGETLELEHFYDHEQTRSWFRTVAVKLGDGFVVTFADVTARRKLEEQLLQSQKMEVVGRLAGGVAHDFNNLLTAIGVNAELALQALPEGAPGRAEVEAMLDSARRAGDLTQQLLAFARRQPITPRIVRLDDLVTHVTRMLARVVGPTIEMAVVPEPDLWPVAIDPLKFEQVITNLVVNAYDAMPKGGRITFELRNQLVRTGDSASVRRVPDGEYTRLDVADTGTGMTPDVLAHLFEPFFTTKEAGKGTGLGLATSYGLIRQSAGYMWATSITGRGATFSILLPRARGVVEPWPPRKTKDAVPTGSGVVLVVEDEPGVRTVVVRTLSRQGFTVREASNGEEALRALEAMPALPRLVLSDIVMPRMGGRELQRAIATRYPTLPVLLMSGYEAGGPQHDVLPKPFTSSVLVSAVRRAIDLGTAP